MYKLDRIRKRLFHDLPSPTKECLGVNQRTQESTLNTDDFFTEDELQCLNCRKYMHPPIRQCISGHSFCNSCFARVAVCSECLQPKSSERHYILETLHSKLLFPCNYYKSGCRRVETGSKMKMHEELCSYRLKPS